MLDWAATGMFYAIFIAKIAIFVGIGKLFGLLMAAVESIIKPIDRLVPWHKQIPSYAVGFIIALIGFAYAGSFIWFVSVPWFGAVCWHFSCP